jgi:hypothetical protein
MDMASGTEQKPATAARMYDYVLGGVHNFPADREAAKKAIEQFPLIPARARANRALLRRMVRQLVDAGVRQFLDIGSGMPTEGNVHEIAQEIDPKARVVYVDVDPVAVAESLEILEGNNRATAIHGDLRKPQAILDHPQVRHLLDVDQPVGLLMVAILHFIADDSEVADAIPQYFGAFPSGGYLAISHSAAEGWELGASSKDSIKIAQDIYKRQTTTPVGVRTRDQIARFFEGCKLVDPGLVWMTEWRPDSDIPAEFADDPQRSGVWAGVGKFS